MNIILFKLDNICARKATSLWISTLGRQLVCNKIFVCRSEIHIYKKILFQYLHFHHKTDNCSVSLVCLHYESVMSRNE